MDDLIYSYSRAQALADGVLIDVTEYAKQVGFRYPVAVTDACWIDACEWTEHDTQGLGQSTEGRLMDVLTMAALSAKSKAVDGDRVRFKVSRIARGGDTHAETIELMAHIGPGDDPSPVITIGFSSDF